MANLCLDCKMRVREQWVKKYLKGGISVPELAKITGVHENTLYNWMGLMEVCPQFPPSNCQP